MSHVCIRSKAHIMCTVISGVDPIAIFTDGANDSSCRTIQRLRQWIGHYYSVTCTPPEKMLKRLTE